jgi:hypothetical protein
MSKYRAVFMVPTIVEFENPGSVEQVTSQARGIARGMGKAKSEVRKLIYIPTVMEVSRQDGGAPPPILNTQHLTPNNLDIRDELDLRDDPAPECA